MKVDEFDNIVNDNFKKIKLNRTERKNRVYIDISKGVTYEVKLICSLFLSVKIKYCVCKM